MEAYLPDTTLTLARLLALLLVEWLAGFGLQAVEPGRFIQVRAWVLLLLSLGAGYLISFHSPAGFRMMALITVLFLGMKAVVAVHTRLSGQAPLSFPRWSAFALAWPGMQPLVFTNRRTRPLPGWDKSALQGLSAILFGAGLIFFSRFLWRETASLLFATIPFFIGSSLIVHFGLFNLATALWRYKGFDCGALFQNPFLSRNLGEFWSKRWNIGFGEMTAVAAYRPLKNLFPAWVGLIAAFGFSGILHEAVISLPVNAGYGLPLFYFLLQGAWVVLERRMAIKGIVLKGIGGLAWILFWLVVPLPVLFHRPFLAGVVWPLIGVKP